MPQRCNAFLDYPPINIAHASSGPLAGETLAIKDIFDVAGHPTGFGNPDWLAEHPAATATNRAIAAMFGAGARYVGKTQCEELTYSLTGINVHFSRAINPAAPERVTGGSSSGSAAAVAGGLCSIATASDTGGSVRAPASFCGLIGLRTTHGRIALDHTCGLAPSFDTFGWYAATPALYARVGRLLLGKDDADTPLSRPLLVPELMTYLDDCEARDAFMDMQAGLLAHFPVAAQDIRLHQSGEKLRLAMAPLQATEAWALHGAWIEAKPRNLDPQIRARFEMGRNAEPEHLARCQAVRQSIRAQMTDLLANDGVLVLPTIPGPAPMATMTADEQQAFRNRAFSLLALSGLTGLPQITLPLGSVHGAPFGISLLGPKNSDNRLIALGCALMADASRGSQ